MQKYTLFALLITLSVASIRSADSTPALEAAAAQKPESPTNFFAYFDFTGFDPDKHKDHSEPTPQEVAAFLSQQVIPCKQDGTVCTLHDPELSLLRFNAPKTNPLMSLKALALLDQSIRGRITKMDFEGAYVGRIITHAADSFPKVENVTIPENVFLVDNIDGRQSFVRAGAPGSTESTFKVRCGQKIILKEDNTITSRCVRVDTISGKTFKPGDTITLADDTMHKLLPNMLLQRIPKQ